MYVDLEKILNFKKMINLVGHYMTKSLQQEKSIVVVKIMAQNIKNHRQNFYPLLVIQFLDVANLATKFYIVMLVVANVIRIESS